MNPENDLSQQLRVYSFEPNRIQFSIKHIDKWKSAGTDSRLKIGSFLKIQDGNHRSIIVIVQSFHTFQNDEEKEELTDAREFKGNFLIDAQPIGQLEDSDELGNIKFISGIKNISIPPNGVSLASEEDLKHVFSLPSGKDTFSFASEISNNSIHIHADGNLFFSKHISVVGSTGSGKSCGVATILQKAISSDEEFKNNTHIILFDIHGEYKHAFPESRYLSVTENTLKLPYWLLNSEELESIFIENGDNNAYNQIAQFKYAVTENKKKYNSNIASTISYDSPVFFSISEVFNYIYNINFATHYDLNNETFFAAKGLSEQKYGDISQLWEKRDFYSTTGNGKNDMLKAKVSSNRNGFFGEFPRFISRFETKLQDNRLQFLLSEINLNDSVYKTSDFQDIIKNILGYGIEQKEDNNVTIIDLSSLPFEVVSLLVSVVSRLAFDFCYYQTNHNETNPTPYLLVYEEAHKYIPKNNESKYKDTRIAVERIAKEGRKYGISSMIVSQRPSEISPTVLSQCNNFVVMKLTNPEDQNFIKNILPESVGYYRDSLNNLSQREALLVGEAISTPCIVHIDAANPVPKSKDVPFYSEWKKKWVDIAFEELSRSIQYKN
jgi:DNA helicase HerA-like ATPase